MLKSLGALNRYGSLGAGAVIVIRTNYGAIPSSKNESIMMVEQLMNQEKYKEDASNLNAQNAHINKYTDTLQKIEDSTKAYLYYNSVKDEIDDFKTHIDIVNNFIKIYGAKKIASSILKEQTLKHESNPETLKALAYQLQSIELKKEAIATYERIFKPRPNYAQSYRDHANAYVENDQYKKAWRLYLSYLLQGNDVSGEGIGKMIYSEMEYLYFNRRNQSEITQTFVPKNESINDFRHDVRLVLEWHTSEAEFDLEFVDPEMRVYNFEHTLASNQELITDEKLKGYSSREFIIDEVGEGEWLVNLTYKGNKKSDPTYFKITSYYHWGKPNQRQEVNIYKLHHQRNKLQLMKINKQLLVASE